MPTSFQAPTQHNTLSCQIPGPTNHRHHIRHLRRPAQPSHRNLRNIPLRAPHNLLPRNHSRPPDHRGRHVIDRDTLARQPLRSQIPRHPHQASLAGRVVAAVDPPAVAGDAGDVDDAAPFLGPHVGHAELGEDEGGAKVDGEHLVEFGEGDVHDVRDAGAVAGVGDKDVGGVAVVVGDFGEEVLDL